MVFIDSCVEYRARNVVFKVCYTLIICILLSFLWNKVFIHLLKMAKGLINYIVSGERKLNRKDKPYAFHPFAVERLSNTSRYIPRSRSGHRIVCDDSNLFCFGGYNPSIGPELTDRDPPTWSETNPLFKELWSYSFASQTWKLLPLERSVPNELASNAMCIEGNMLMIYGGTGYPFGYHCSNNVYTYHVSGRKGGLLLLSAGGQKPNPQYGQAILCHDGYLYAVGGTNGFNYTCDVHRLNLRTGIWETTYTCCGNRLNEPAGRYRHEMAFDGKNLYILAGGTANSAFDFVEIPIFNLETKTWSFKTSKPDLRFPQAGHPLPRMCHSAVQINNANNIHVFIIGGTGGDVIYNDIWRLEIPSLEWTLMTKTVLPKKVHFHSSAVTPAGCVYTFGGVQLKQNTYIRTNTLYKVWICIPKLSEMCWESILHYNPKINKVDKSRLLTAGIPSDFVRRLES